MTNCTVHVDAKLPTSDDGKFLLSSLCSTVRVLLKWRKIPEGLFTSDTAHSQYQ